MLMYSSKIRNRNSVSAVEQAMKLINALFSYADKKGMVGIIKTAVHSSSFRQSYIPSNKGVK